jgi:hypothetical protein
VPRVFPTLCALALSSMCEIDMTPCEEVAAKLADPNLPPRERLRLERENLEHCQEGGDQKPDSGGHGPTVPN